MSDKRWCLVTNASRSGRVAAHCCFPVEAYHAQVVQLGLQQLVPQLAALCPDADKRAALVEAHKQYLEALSEVTQAPTSRNAKGWVPPEAAMAALAEVEVKGSWTCDRCTLVNAPSSRACEVCSAPRPKAPAGKQGSSAAGVAAGAGSSSARGAAEAGPAAAGSSWSAAAAAGGGSSSSSSANGAGSSSSSSRAAAQQPAVQQAVPAGAESWPGLPGGKGSKASKKPAAAPAAAPVPAQQAGSSSDAGAAASSSSQQQAGKKKKGSKQPLSDLLTAGKTHPQNAWSQQQRLSGVVAAPSGGRGSMGQWGKQGGAKLAKSISAFNDAWSKP